MKYSTKVLIEIVFIWISVLGGLTLIMIFAEKNKKEKIKTEYKLELINQTEIKVYSISNDTTYICTLDKLVEVIEKDNL